MDRQLREHWETIAGDFAATFQPLAGQIAAYERADFQLLWMLSDFTELCIKYCSLLMLGQAFHDPALRDVLFQKAISAELVPPPSFGTRLGFFERAIRQLRREGHAVPFPGLLEFADHPQLEAGKVLNMRNTLAHGLPSRYDVNADEVNGVCRQVLDVVQALQETCSASLQVREEGVVFVHPGSAGEFPLYPFVVDAGRGAPAFYECVKRNTALFSSLSQVYPRPDLAPTIMLFLRQGRVGDEQPGDGPQDLTPHDRSRMLVEQFRGRVDDSYYGREFLLRELPEQAGRPTLLRNLLGPLTKQETPLTYCLYGRRGLGKRRWLAELLQSVQQQEHVAVPLIVEDLDGMPLASCWNAALQVEGSLSDLAALSGGPKSRRRVILAVDDVDALLAHETRRRELQEVVRRQQDLRRLHLVLLSDTPRPLTYDWACRPDFVQIPFPLMEEEGRRQFYERITSTVERAPLSTWNSLSDDVKTIAGAPVDVVRLCRRYRGSVVPDEILLYHDMAEPWDGDMEEMWRTLVLEEPRQRALAAELAREMLQAGQDELSWPAALAGLAQDERAQAYATLKAVGILTESAAASDEGLATTTRFASYYWLVRALQLVEPMASPASPLDSSAARHLADDELKQVIGHCERFAPCCEALSLWAADSPARLSEIFLHILVSDTPVLNRLVESFLVRAWPDPELFETVVAALLDQPREEAVSGCAAAAQQLVDSGDNEAIIEGIQLYSRLIDVCRSQAYEQLEARLLNEFGLFGVTAGSPQTQRDYFRAALEKAERLQLDDLAEVARNNVASIDVERAEALAVTQPAEARQAATLAVELLRQAGPLNVTARNWRHARSRIGFLARAHAVLNPEPGGSAAHDNHRRAIDLCRRFGNAVDLGWACNDYARFHADQGEFPKAHELHAESIRWMETAGEAAGHSRSLAEKGRTLLLQDSAASDAERKQGLLRAAWKQFRLAYELLENAPRGSSTERWLAELRRQLSSVSGALEELG